jgi:dTDP-4-dehydrorhamnose reductase
MKLLVFGQSGQVARELMLRCPCDIAPVFVGRDVADLSAPEQCARIIEASGAHAVINAAAYTAVDRAEGDEAGATVVNGDAPAAMARACATLAVPLLHLSTDYVFDGSGSTPFTPQHPPAPRNAYGRSKLAGEVGVRESGARHLILRTSWVVSAHGTNFVRTMLRLGQERPALQVVADQIGAPTPAAAIADALYTAVRALLAGHTGGTYHFAGAPDTSWAEFARVIMRAADLACVIEDIPSSAYPTPAPRPLNSQLDCSSFFLDFGVARPDWRSALDDILLHLRDTP